MKGAEGEMGGRAGSEVGVFSQRRVSTSIPELLTDERGSWGKYIQGGGVVGTGSNVAGGGGGGTKP